MASCVTPVSFSPPRISPVHSSEPRSTVSLRWRGLPEKSESGRRPFVEIGGAIVSETNTVMVVPIHAHEFVTRCKVGGALVSETENDDDTPEAAGDGEVFDPTALLKKLGVSHKRFALFLRKRHKAWKDLKFGILEQFESLRDFASGYKSMGMHRDYHHRVDFVDWVPGAVSLSIVGDFNEWSPTANRAREAPHGRDSLGYWSITLEDILREGEEPDKDFFQIYNYVDDHDRGDSGVCPEEIIANSSIELWGMTEEEREEERRRCPDLTPEQIACRVFEKFLGPNGPATGQAWDALLDGLKKDLGMGNEEQGSGENAVLKASRFWIGTRKGRKAWMEKYYPAVPHGTKYRVRIKTPGGSFERVPAWATYVIPEVDGGLPCAVHWELPPQCSYRWMNRAPRPPRSRRIYECHVGISGSAPEISSFGEFREKVLPHVKNAGYNTIQLFGLVEHKDYSSGGFMVTNFFAVSSRYGTPEDFKRLVDAAHGLGLSVFLNIVHSYAPPDEMVGLSMFDGENDCYFHRGKFRRNRTRIFKYADEGVVHFLLSNLCWWVEEYRIDGLHFHSLPSMIYTGELPSPSTENLDDYCGRRVDIHALVYLITANEVLHRFFPGVITIADDETLYPGLCDPISRGGIGFDYCTHSFISSTWKSMAENHSGWRVSEIAATLNRYSHSIPSMVLYSENHSASRALADVLTEELHASPSSLHKMIRLVTFTAGGRGYLNFMGNEFGHPKSVEFPTKRNGGSFSLARRRWDLLEEGGGGDIHRNLFRFDQALMGLDEREGVLGKGFPDIHHVSDSAMVMCYLNGPLLFVFNFHPTKSYEGYDVGTDESGHYRLILDTDDAAYGGDSRIHDGDALHVTLRRSVDGLENSLRLHLPSRTAQVYKLVGFSSS